LLSPSVRARYVGGHVYQPGPSIGYPPVVTANRTTGISQGGVYRVDATAGNITITLVHPGTAWTPNITHGERYTFVRVVTASNTITIAAGVGSTIEGAASVNLGGALYSKLTLVWSAQDLMWLIL